jgi:hypothetical protein
MNLKERKVKLQVRCQNLYYFEGAYFILLISGHYFAALQ